MFPKREGLATTVTILAHNHPFVTGVDTHARTHVLAILTATGQQVDSAESPTSKTGMARALTWIARRTGDDLATLWVLEYTATFDAQLTQAATGAEYEILETPRMNTRTHHRAGKPDPLDTRRIAKAAFACLARVNPIPASSGNTTRHRLNRGGDPHLNRTLHTATITRITHDPTTRDHVERHRAEGPTTKETPRHLKRYLTRQTYRHLNATNAPSPPT